MFTDTFFLTDSRVDDFSRIATFISNVPAGAGWKIFFHYA